MHRASDRTIPAIAIGLLAVIMLVASLAMVGLGATPSTHAAAVGAAPNHAAVVSPRAASPASGWVSHSAVPHPLASTTIANITGITGPGSPTTIPIAPLSINLNVTWGNVTNATTNMWVTLVDMTASTLIATFTLNGTVNASTANGAGGPVTSGTSGGVPWSTANFATALNQTTLGCGVANCSDMLTYDDEYNVTWWVNQNDTSDGGSVSNTWIAGLFVYVSHITTSTLSVTPINARYNALPLQVNFTVAVLQDGVYANNSIDSATTVLNVQITDAITSGVQSSWDVPVVTGQSAYSFWIDDTNLSCPGIDPTCQSITDPYYVTVTATVDLTGAPFYGTPAGPVSAGLTTPTGFLTFAFITVPVTLTPLAPATSTVALGNVTFSSTYSGQYILSANVTVFSSTNAKLPIFYANMLKTASGTPVTAVWAPAAPGAYPISFALTTIYGNTLNGTTIYKNSTLTVASVGGGVVYFNTTTWHNGTGILGLSAPVGGVILLLVGLIIGLIVAFLLGRAVWSRPAAEPAQPWASSTTTTTTTGANTCSACGKSFDTPEELAAHAKSEHGM